MASFSIFIFILLITLSSSLHTHARDSQFFNKIPSTTNTNPNNENSYGLYRLDSGQLPPSAAAAQPLPKYLPKNYNPTAYVTQPGDMSDSTTPYTEEKSYSIATNPNGNYYNNQQEEEPEYTNSRNSYNYRLGSSFNSQPQGFNDAALTGRENYGGGVNGRYQPQGMSDTRFVENGKYFYDVNSEKYSNNHPYESLRATNEYNNNRNYYANSEVNMGGYENQVDDNNMP